MITIFPKGGLSNYLRVVFSYYEYAKSINQELKVIWIKTKHCPGNFLDYFEPVENIIFIDFEPETKIDYKGSSGLPNPKYDQLKLKPYLEKIIFDKINILNKNYISVHIRRTDHIEYTKKINKYTTDEDFINFLDKYDKNIYIATDNETTYDIFKEKYKNRIKFDYHKTIKNSFRHTSLEDAIIDIYMCVNSDEFKRSGWSSFSDLINVLRMKKPVVEKPVVL